MADDQIKSRYEPLTVPEFKSVIPAHLLGKLTEQERYLVETLSKMEQQNSWLILASVKANTAIIDLDTRQTRSEVWKDRLMSKWSLLAVAGALIVPMVVKALFDHYVLGKKGP
jgi:hypothetical protein